MVDKEKVTKTRSHKTGGGRTSCKTGSTKLWKAVSHDSPEIFWVRGRTKAEVKKHLRHFFRSESYWEGEPDPILSTEIFKSYGSNLSDCPGRRVDDTRGDVLYSLTDASRDWIDRNASEGDKKKEEKVIQDHHSP